LYEKSNRYKKNDEHYLSLIQHIKRLESVSKDNIVINQIDLNRYFPVSPFSVVRKRKSIFLNAYFFGSYKCYTDSWKNICTCDALSLKSKIDYLVDNHLHLLIDDKTLIYLKEYIYRKYKTEIGSVKLASLDGELYTYYLFYK